MKLLLVALFFVSAGNLLAGTRRDVTIMVDGIQRQFIVVRPEGTPPAGGFPVVFMFHGTSGDGEKFFNISQWKEKGEKEKFITVFPSSLEYCIIDNGKQKRTTKWHNGELEEVACPGEKLADDVKFVRRMLDTITGTFQVNAARMYASGFSNGAGFVSKLAVEMSDVFAAFAPHAGALPKSDSATAKRNAPVWFTLGTNDEAWLEGYSSLGLTEFPFNDTALVYLSPALRRFLGVLGLKETRTKTESPVTITYTFNTPASVAGGKNNIAAATSEFKFTLIKGLSHQYPNGTNVPVTIADYYWDFFRQYSLPATGVEEFPDDEELTVYPNPAANTITIPGTGEISVTMRDMLGRTAMEITSQRGASITLPDVLAGLYAVEIRAGSATSRSMIAVQR